MRAERCELACSGLHVLQTARPSPENRESTSVPVKTPYKINRFMCEVTAKCIFIGATLSGRGEDFEGKT